MTNIAYIVLCHDQPELLAKAAQALRYQEDKLFVHVDQKSDIQPFQQAVKGLDNVVFVENRVKNYWGGFHSIIATMEALRLALSDKTKYHRFVLLQGKDYPLHHPAYIHRFFAERPEEEFLKAHDITASAQGKEKMLTGGYWFFDTDSWLMKKVLARVLHKWNAMVHVPYRKRYFSHKGQDWHIYKGWAQFAITRDCAKLVLDTYDTNPAFNNFMRHRFPPDETYIHTIVHNSPFAKRISQYTLIPRQGEPVYNEMNLTYFEYPVFVTVFDDSYSYQELNRTGGLFVRKLILPDSENLILDIDAHMQQEAF